MIETQQILIPKKIHIGDTAELRCTFHADSQYFKALVADGTASLPISIFDSYAENDDFEILEVFIAPAGVNYYQLNISFIPWKAGTIKLPDLVVNDIAISIKPEEIESLTKLYNTTSLKNSTAPLLLPGTAYKLWGRVILCVAILILGINLIVRRKKVSFFFKNKILQIKYRRNKKLTIKNLKKIMNLDCSDSKIAEEIQHVLRKYLDFRFAYPFSNVVTSELMITFNKITEMLLSDNKYEAFGEIANAFIRTDYIRYGSSNKDAIFMDREEIELIDNIIKNIEILEGDDKEVEKEDENA